MCWRFQIGSNKPIANVLRRFLAEEVIDTEHLILVEDLVHCGVQLL
jgi:hypothetical protein